ncbi:MAG: dependent oxidoreductase [Acidimicrobiales bacterium]|nr:dependent oxidoreductase [Acidimicrobiales bacterium]
MGAVAAAVAIEHVDVLIIGGGLSGIGAACHLLERCPDKTFAVLEARGATGGTWDLFRYPGVRSDSDMFTLGYSFRPWEEPKAIADGDSIRTYIRDTARDHGVTDKIRLHHRVTKAAWSTADARWTVEVERADTGTSLTMTCGFLHSCSGYYRYDEGYTPDLPGLDRFTGTVVHPQLWPEDLDYADKQVVVIGSGATAVTLVPAMADRAAHVTMLQRSPGYVVAVPGADRIADVLRRRLPKKLAYAIVRWKNVLLTMLSYQLSRGRPELMKRIIRKSQQPLLPADFDHETHLAPTYNPWDQRLCLAPDGDFFASISEGRSSIVTDRIATFTEHGVLLVSGRELEADIIVTATGLNLQFLGGATLTVDGREIELSECVTYKGMMLCGVPNFAMTMGYTNASWTLKADLVCEYVCRLLRHLDERGCRQATPRAPDPALGTEPFLGLQAGYILRADREVPRQGTTPPWRLHQNYPRDVLLLRHGRIEDGALEVSNRR